MSAQEAVTLLASRGHSKRAVAEILGISRTTLLHHCDSPEIPWAPRYETIEYLEAKQDRPVSERQAAHLRRLQQARRDKHLRTVRGVSGTLQELAKHFGIVSVRTAERRMASGEWDVEMAVTVPPTPSNLRRDRNREFCQ